MEVVEHFDRLTYWNLENKPSSDDAIHKAFDWLNMAHVVSYLEKNIDLILLNNYNDDGDCWLNYKKRGDQDTYLYKIKQFFYLICVL